MGLRIFVEKPGDMKIIFIFTMIDLERKVVVNIVFVTQQKYVDWIFSEKIPF